MAMVQGVNGYFDIVSENVSTFTARIFYDEQYDPNTGKHIASITGVSIKSTVYGQSWYPNGKITINGEIVGEMNNSQPATHTVSLTAGSDWHKVVPYYGGNDFPWVSSEIASDADGNKTIVIAVDFLLYRDSSAPIPSFVGSQEIALTPVTPKHTVAYNDNGTAVKCFVYRNDNGTAVRCTAYYNDNGTAVKL